MDDREAYEFYADPANLVPAGPARRRRRPPKTAILSVRIDPARRAAIERIADAWGLDVSDWVRGALRREEYRHRVKWLDRHRGELEVVPGSSRAGVPVAIPSSLSLPSARTFACLHFSIGNVASASCGVCGPLPVAA